MTTTQFFVDLENNWMAAAQRKDAEALENILGPDFKSTTVGSNGELMDRAAWIDYVCKAEATNRVHDVSVRTYGDTAVVNLMLEFTGDWNSDFLITDVWVKYQDDWKVVHRHNSYPSDAYTVNS